MLDRLDDRLRNLGIPFVGTERNRIHYALEATEQQRADGDAVLASFDWSDSAHQAWLDNQKPERRDLRHAATQAIADIDAYLAIGSPNNAQVVAQVRRLSQYTKAIIKRLVQID